ncbi:MAG: hypothetical protein A2Z14_12060 [Chloroflexi bacterium RBG_16_48_8]|nr:MAG: hypothetical protein A2Z14_12060 [Chloroflexi bacterium RBG_16_48_8]
MKHRLYEGWIMARDELTPDQRRDLEAHVKECMACTQLAETGMVLDRVFASSQMSEPMPGFAQRWKIRVGERRIKTHRRQVSMILGLLSFGATALFLPLILQTILIMISPEDILFHLAGVLVEWLSFLGFIGELVVTFFTTLYSTIPVVLWLMIMVVLVVMGVLWGYSLQRLGYLPSRERS